MAAPIFSERTTEAARSRTSSRRFRLDPRHFESYRNVDWLLAQRGDWDGVITHWTRYIELEPLNGQAYLERGGAYHRKGDQRAALADADKACGLGAPRAWELIGHGSATR